MTRASRDQRAPVPCLAGTGRLADDLYLMAHHERTGRPLLAARAAGLGLAGALLGELILAGAISVTAGQVTVTGPAPGEELAAAVLGLVAGEQQQRPAGEWLAFLARTAPADVAGRLERAGYLTAGRSWRGPRWVPVDADCAFGPIARVNAGLDRGPPIPRPWRWPRCPRRAGWAPGWGCTCPRRPVTACPARPGGSIPRCGR